MNMTTITVFIVIAAFTAAISAYGSCRRNRQTRRLVSVLCLVTALATSAPVTAQEASKLGPQAAEIEKEGVSSGDDARRTMYAFAACVLHRHRLQALKWLSLPPEDPTLTQKAYSFADDECLMNGMMQFSPMLFRGALYVALYHQEFGSKPLNLAPVPTAVAAGNGGPAVHAYDMLFQFADCVARRDPSTVRTLILAAPGSPGESNALSSLSPQFPLCLVKDAQFQLNKATLTALLAEALYRLSSAPAPVAAAGVSH